eukprot:jgi/Mesvir1/7528/Mv19277-RA.1
MVVTSGVGLVHVGSDADITVEVRALQEDLNDVIVELTVVSQNGSGRQRKRRAVRRQLLSDVTATAVDGSGMPGTVHKASDHRKVPGISIMDTTEARPGIKKMPGDDVAVKGEEGIYFRSRLFKTAVTTEQLEGSGEGRFIWQGGDRVGVDVSLRELADERDLMINRGQPGRDGRSSDSAADQLLEDWFSAGTGGSQPSHSGAAHRQLLQTPGSTSPPPPLMPPPPAFTSPPPPPASASSRCSAYRIVSANASQGWCAPFDDDACTLRCHLDTLAPGSPLALIHLRVVAAVEGAELRFVAAAEAEGVPASLDYRGDFKGPRGDRISAIRTVDTHQAIIIPQLDNFLLAQVQEGAGTGYILYGLSSPVRFDVRFGITVACNPGAAIVTTQGTGHVAFSLDANARGMPRRSLPATVSPLRDGLLLLEALPDQCFDIDGLPNLASEPVWRLLDVNAPTVRVTGLPSAMTSAGEQLAFAIQFSERVFGLSERGVHVTNGNLTRLDTSTERLGFYVAHVAPSREGYVFLSVLPGAARDVTGKRSHPSRTERILYYSPTPRVEGFVRKASVAVGVTALAALLNRGVPLGSTALFWMHVQFLQMFSGFQGPMGPGVREALFGMRWVNWLLPLPLGGNDDDVDDWWAVEGTNNATAGGGNGTVISVGDDSGDETSTSSTRGKAGVNTSRVDDDNNAGDPDAAKGAEPPAVLGDRPERLLLARPRSLLDDGTEISIDLAALRQLAKESYLEEDLAPRAPRLHRQALTDFTSTGDYVTVVIVVTVLTAVTLVAHWLVLRVYQAKQRKGSGSGGGVHKDSGGGGGGGVPVILAFPRMEIFLAMVTAAPLARAGAYYASTGGGAPVAVGAATLAVPLAFALLSLVLLARHVVWGPGRRAGGKHERCVYHPHSGARPVLASKGYTSGDMRYDGGKISQGERWHAAMGRVCGWGLSYRGVWTSTRGPRQGGGHVDAVARYGTYFEHLKGPTLVDDTNRVRKIISPHANGNKTIINDNQIFTHDGSTSFHNGNGEEGPRYGHDYGQGGSMDDASMPDTPGSVLGDPGTPASTHPARKPSRRGWNRPWFWSHRHQRQGHESPSVYADGKDPGTPMGRASSPTPLIAGSSSPSPLMMSPSPLPMSSSPGGGEASRQGGDLPREGGPGSPLVGVGMFGVAEGGARRTRTRSSSWRPALCGAYMLVVLTKGLLMGVLAGIYVAHDDAVQLAVGQAVLMTAWLLLQTLFVAYLRPLASRAVAGAELSSLACELGVCACVLALVLGRAEQGGSEGLRRGGTAAMAALLASALAIQLLTQWYLLALTIIASIRKGRGSLQKHELQGSPIRPDPLSSHQPNGQTMYDMNNSYPNAGLAASPEPVGRSQSSSGADTPADSPGQEAAFMRRGPPLDKSGMFVRTNRSSTLAGGAGTTGHANSSSVLPLQERVELSSLGFGKGLFVRTRAAAPREAAAASTEEDRNKGGEKGARSEAYGYTDDDSRRGKPYGDEVRGYDSADEGSTPGDLKAQEQRHKQRQEEAIRSSRFGRPSPRSLANLLFSDSPTGSPTWAREEGKGASARLPGLFSVGSPKAGPADRFAKREGSSIVTPTRVADGALPESQPGSPALSPKWTAVSPRRRDVDWSPRSGSTFGRGSVGGDVEGQEGQRWAGKGGLLAGGQLGQVAAGEGADGDVDSSQQGAAGWNFAQDVRGSLRMGSQGPNASWSTRMAGTSSSSGIEEISIADDSSSRAARAAIAAQRQAMKQGGAEDGRPATAGAPGGGGGLDEDGFGIASYTLPYGRSNKAALGGLGGDDEDEAMPQQLGAKPAWQMPAASTPVGPGAQVVAGSGSGEPAATSSAPAVAHGKVARKEAPPVEKKKKPRQPLWK